VKKNLVLVGMMASGKTTIGKLVAKIKDLEFVDTDKSIEKKNSMTIYEIFKKKGEKFFREEEKKEVLKNLEKKNCIIAVGGGSFVNKSIRENILKNAISFWLDVDIKTLNKRLKWNKNRPLLNKKNNMKKLNNLYAERKKIYELADHKIECEQLTKENIVKKIILLYEKY
jgi:shikimate kinase/shikimate kinase/3-dehydroquinate synthase